MGANAAADRLTVEQLTESDVDAIRVAIRTALLNVHTSMPGIVKAFDKASQTATVQPAIQSEYVDLGMLTLPLIPKVPVLFLGGGGYVQTFPVAAGDECLLVFSERAIDGWFQNGGVSPPSDDRVHDLTDGFALVGFRSIANAIQDFDDEGAVFLVPDGGVYILGGKGTVSVPAEFTVKGDKLSDYLDIMATVINGLAPGSVQLYAAIASNPALAYKATKIKVL